MGSDCELATEIIAGCARWMGVAGLYMPKSGARTLRRHSFMRHNNTNISLQSARRRGICRLWYSGSVVQFRVLTVSLAGHHMHLACDLRASWRGGFDLLARLCMACGLNSRQINHLQRIASETHYRGQSCPRTTSGQKRNRR